jgi:hypothetical protein
MLLISHRTGRPAHSNPAGHTDSKPRGFGVPSARWVNAGAKPDVVDHVNDALLCTCGHICSADLRTTFGMTEWVRLPERPDLRASTCDLAGAITWCDCCPWWRRARCRSVLRVASARYRAAQHGRRRADPAGPSSVLPLALTLTDSCGLPRLLAI